MRSSIDQILKNYNVIKDGLPPYKKAKGVNTLLPCPNCGEKFNFVKFGARAGVGKCSCGFTMIS